MRDRDSFNQGLRDGAAARKILSSEELKELNFSEAHYIAGYNDGVEQMKKPVIRRGWPHPVTEARLNEIGEQNQ